MIKDKMIMNDNDIDAMLNENEDKYKVVVSQTLSRIDMFRDGKNKVNDNWLQPYCFDQLKKFIRNKKLVKDNFRKLEKFLQKGTGDIADAFN